MLRTTEILNSYFDLTVKDLISSYEQKGLKASGKYARSLVKEITESGTMTTAKIKGANHAYWMQHGRNPNKQQTAQQARSLGKILEQWVKDKGIVANPYAIAWKIVREGIQVPNQHNPGGVVSDVINDDWLAKIIKQIHGDVILSAKSEVLTAFKK